MYGGIKMNVKVLEYTPFNYLEYIFENFNEDCYEHIKITFHIKGVSRGLLQELVRHQHLTGYSVKSTRYPLKQ